jgi:hypothetical protein
MLFWVIDERIPKNHLLRRINAFMTEALAVVHEQLDPYCSETGRPSVDPELMIRMLIIGTATSCGQNASCLRKSSCTWPIGGSAGLNSTTRPHTIRPFLRTACIGFGKAMSFAHRFARREPSYACGVVLCSMLVIRSISSLWAPR